MANNGDLGSYHAVVREDYSQRGKVYREEATEARKHGVSYAQIAVKWGFLLNGGALIALPALVNGFGENGFAEIEFTEVRVAALCYVLGLLFLTVCCVAAFLNFDRIAEIGSSEAVKTTWQSYELLSSSENEKVRAGAAVSDIDKNVTADRKLANVYYYISFFSGCAGLLLFFCGSLYLIW